MTPKEYDALVRQLSPRSPIGKDTALAFVIGGAICTVGQLISAGWQSLGLTQADASAATSVTLVFLSVLATSLGLYHRLARYAGAGTLVPITGFANAVASPAIDFRAEGVITGTAVKMFTVAGPVIVFGAAARDLGVHGLVAVIHLVVDLDAGGFLKVCEYGLVDVLAPVVHVDHAAGGFRAGAVGIRGIAFPGADASGQQPGHDGQAHDECQSLFQFLSLSPFGF